VQTDITDLFPLLASDGTASAPSYSFLSDSDTGAFRVSANVYGMAAGGEKVAEFTTGAQRFCLYAGPTADHVYLALFADSAAQTTRSAYIGYPSSGTNDLYITNEQGNGIIALVPAGTGYTLTNKQFLNSANFQCDTYYGYSDTSKYLQINSSTFAYGGWLLNGSRNSYSGITINAGTINPTLMSNGEAAGVFNHGDGSWSFYRASSTRVISNYRWGFDDGTVSEPAMSFYNDTNTGLYRRGADDLGIVIGGSLAMSINGVSTTGTQTATFSATNKPGSGTAGPISWLPVVTSGGTTGYIPIFGA
jgi:hypothetical protein